MVDWVVVIVLCSVLVVVVVVVVVDVDVGWLRQPPQRYIWMFGWKILYIIHHTWDLIVASFAYWRVSRLLFSIL
jgi:hypothetical protein